MDSTALHLLLDTHCRLRSLSRKLAIICPAGPVRRLLELTGATEHLPIHDDRAAAPRGVTADRPRVAMNPSLSARAVADKARKAVSAVRPGSTDGRRSPSIRSTEADLRRLRDAPVERARILDGMPIADAALTLGPEMGDWRRRTRLGTPRSASSSAS